MASTLKKSPTPEEVFREEIQRIVALEESNGNDESLMIQQITDGVEAACKKLYEAVVTEETKPEWRREQLGDYTKIISKIKVSDGSLSQSLLTVNYNRAKLEGNPSDTMVTYDLSAWKVKAAQKQRKSDMEIVAAVDNEVWKLILTGVQKIEAYDGAFGVAKNGSLSQALLGASKDRARLEVNPSDATAAYDLCNWRVITVEKQGLTGEARINAYVAAVAEVMSLGAAEDLKDIAFQAIPGGIHGTIWQRFHDQMSQAAGQDLQNADIQIANNQLAVAAAKEALTATEESLKAAKKALEAASSALGASQTARRAIFKRVADQMAGNSSRQPDPDAPVGGPNRG
jgi:hypothetical protein